MRCESETQLQSVQMTRKKFPHIQWMAQRTEKKKSTPLLDIKDTHTRNYTPRMESVQAPKGLKMKIRISNFIPGFMTTRSHQRFVVSAN